MENLALGQELWKASMVIGAIQSMLNDPMETLWQALNTRRPNQLELTPHVSIFKMIHRINSLVLLLIVESYIQFD